MRNGPLAVVGMMRITALSLLLCLAASALVAQGAAAPKFVVFPPKASTAKPELSVLPGRRATVKLAAFSPDGKTLAVAGLGNGAILLWDMTTGRLAHALTGHTDELYALAFSPDGNTLATGAADRTVRVWEVATGRAQQTLAQHTDRVMALAFSADGAQLASGGADRRAIVWTLADGKAATVITEMRDAVTALAFSPEGTQLAMGGMDRRVVLWDLAAGQAAQNLPTQTAAVAGLAFQPNGATLAITVGTFAASERRFINCSASLYPLQGGNAPIALPAANGCAVLGFTPDGGRVITATGDRMITLREAANGLLQSSMIGQLPAPDLSRAITWERDGRLTIWDAKTRRALGFLVGFDGGDAWLSAVPQGYYDGSPGADALVGWRFGADAPYPCAGFAARFHKPELVRKAMAGDALADAPALDGTRLPPNVGFAAPAADTEAKSLVVEVQVQAAGLRPIARIELTVNGKPLSPAQARPLVFQNPEQTQVHVPVTLRLPLSDTRFTLQAVAHDVDDQQSSPASLTLYAPGTGGAFNTLHVLCIGGGRYRSPDLPVLPHAAADAKAIASLFSEDTLLTNGKAVKVTLLQENEVTATAIRGALREIANTAGKDDLVLFYLAGHRVRETRGGNLYFATYDTDINNPRATALNWSELTSLINYIRNPRMLVLIDVPRSSASPLALRLDSAKWCFAGKPDEMFVPQDGWQHGALAQAVMEAVRGKADAGKPDGAVTLGEIGVYVRQRVGELTGNAQQPQWPTLDDAQQALALTVFRHPPLAKVTPEELAQALDAGVQDVQRTDSSGRTLLHLAVGAGRADLVDLLLAREAKANAADASGVTPLHIAVSGGQQALTEKLLARGGDLAVKDKAGHHALDLAHLYEQYELLDGLLAMLPPDARDQTGKTVLHMAVAYNRPKAVTQLLARGGKVDAADADGNTLLHWAVQLGNPAMTTLLLDKNAFPGAVNNNGLTALHLAVIKGDAKMTELLLERRAKIDTPDKRGRTPLHWAAEAGNAAMVSILAKRGANLNAQDADKLSPLHLAVSEKKADIVTLLLQLKASVDVRDKSTFVPLHWAASQDTPDILALLLAARANASVVDKDQNTPLHIAAWFNRTENLTRLLDAGAQVNAKNKTGQTPMAMAKQNKAAEAYELLKARGGTE